MFKSVVEPTASISEYTLLPKEVFSKGVEVVVGGVPFTSDEEKWALQEALVSGWRLREGIGEVKVVQSSAPATSTLIRGGLALTFASVLWLAFYALFPHFLGQGTAIRYTLLLGPLAGATALLLGGWVKASYQARPRPLKAGVVVAGKQVSAFRRELEAVGKRRGWDDTRNELKYLLYLTACMDRHLVKGNKSEYARLEAIFHSKLNHYKDRMMKQQYFQAQGTA